MCSSGLILGVLWQLSRTSLVGHWSIYHLIYLSINLFTWTKGTWQRWGFSTQPSKLNNFQSKAIWVVAIYTHTHKDASPPPNICNKIDHFQRNFCVLCLLFRRKLFNKVIKWVQEYSRKVISAHTHTHTRSDSIKLNKRRRLDVRCMERPQDVCVCVLFAQNLKCLSCPLARADCVTPSHPVW